LTKRPMVKVIILLTIIIGMCWKSVLVGMDMQAAIELQARQELINSQAEKVKIVYKEKIKIEVKYRDRVKTIYQTVDPTGCADKRLSDTGGLFLPSTTEN